MKRSILGIIFVYVSLLALAQSYPSEWSKFTSDGFLYDVQVGKNESNRPIAEFKNELAEVAVTNLAKQIKLHIKDEAQINKIAIDGHSQVTYQVSTSFSTDVELSLVTTRSEYNELNNEGYAIAYIDKKAAYLFYENQLKGIRDEIDAGIAIAQKYCANKMNKRAEAELQNALNIFSGIEQPLIWLNIFGGTSEQFSKLQQAFNQQKQQINQMLIEMRHGVTIYLHCSAEIFGEAYNAFEKELKGSIRSNEYSFTDSINQADWIIEVKCDATEYNSSEYGKTTTYFSHANGNVRIIKTISDQVVCEDSFSAKGGHTISYAKAAMSAYKELKLKLSKCIKEHISE